MYNSHFNSCDCLALILSLKLVSLLHKPVVYLSFVCCLFDGFYTHTHRALPCLYVVPGMWFPFATIVPSFRTGQASVLAKLTNRFWLPAKGSLGHNLLTLVKFQDPQNVLATHEQENCATVSSTPFRDLPIKWANELLMYQMLTEIFTWRFNFKDQISIFWWHVSKRNMI